jgi:hypothetical protein
MSKIQSVLFDRNLYTTTDALRWVNRHRIIPLKKAEIGPRYIHIRVRNPREFERIRTLNIAHGIELRVGFM